MQAEICPKCGVRQAPPPGTPAAPAGTASPKGGGGKGCLIACVVVLALLVIGFIVGPILVTSQAQSYRMRAFNKLAESDLRNLATMQYAFHEDYKVYGVTCLGTAEAGCAEGQALKGPLPASGRGSEGAQIGAILPGGKKVSLPITVGSQVVIGAHTVNAGRDYFAIAKHEQGDRLFAVSSTTDHKVYFCENKAWIGLEGPTDFTMSKGIGVGKPCGGSPVSTWQAL